MLKIVASMIKCLASDHLSQKGPNCLEGNIYIQNIKRLGDRRKKRGKRKWRLVW